MVLLLLQDQNEGWTHSGYTKAVDWWSLGVTIYRLLTNSFPFQVVFLEQLTTDFDSEGFQTQMDSALAKYSSLFEAVDYSRLSVFPAAVDLISKLLVPEEKDRLGFGSLGSREVSSHPFFEAIDWVLLERKLAVPPPKPAGWSSSLGKNALARKYETVEHMLFAHGKVRWLQHKESSSEKSKKAQSVFTALRPAISKKKSEKSDTSNPADFEEEMQSQFQHWDYTSAAAVKLEIGNRSYGSGFSPEI